MEVDSRKKELDQKDKFVAMATAKAEVDLKLSEFQACPMLVTPGACDQSIQCSRDRLSQPSGCV